MLSIRLYAFCGEYINVLNARFFILFNLIGLWKSYVTDVAVIFPEIIMTW